MQGNSNTKFICRVMRNSLGYALDDQGIRVLFPAVSSKAAVLALDFRD